MEYFELFAVGFFVGVIVTAVYGTRIANSARSDTTALINGVENRLHARLDGFKTTAIPSKWVATTRQIEGAEDYNTKR